MAQADEIHHKKKVELEPIREELEQKFRETHGYIDLSKLNSNEPIELETDIHKNPSAYPANEVVTLRIRTETGKRTLLLKLHISDKIS